MLLLFCETLMISGGMRVWNDCLGGVDHVGYAEFYGSVKGWLLQMNQCGIDSETLWLSKRAS